MLCIGVNRENADRVLDIARSEPDVYCTIGEHPLEMSKDGNASPGAHDTSWIRPYLDEPEVVGIGETGLDYHYAQDCSEIQQKSFEQHLQLAVENDKPVIVHTRNARQDTLSLIRAYSPEIRGVLHCFTEDWEMASAALDLGFYISFSGIITFNNASTLREVVRQVPLDSLLVETDSPWLAPVPHRGKQNQPAFVHEVAKCVADLKGESYETICIITGQNFARLFRIEDFGESA